MRILFWATAAKFLSGSGVEVLMGCCAKFPRGKFPMRALGAHRGRAPNVGPAPLGRICRLRATAGTLAGGALLLDDLGHHARADRAAALADREAQTGVHG